MNVLNCCLRSRIINSSIISSLQRPYATTVYYGASVIRLSADRSSVRTVLSNRRCFMKKMGLDPKYNVYDKKAAQDHVSPAEYELVYQGTGEKYVRWLSGMVVVALTIVPTVFVLSYAYLAYTEGQIDFKTYLNLLFLPGSAFEVVVLLSVLFVMKIASYSFISKYVLRIYRHNSNAEYVGVYINPFVPWKNVTCRFDRAVKLPDGKIFIVPWHKEYYRLAGHKSIILKERFRRPIDYDRMLGLEKTLDE